MDATELLIKDHKTIRNLLNKADQAADRNEQSVVIQQLYFEIESHANAEEEILYPLFEDKKSELIESFYDEHQEVRDLLGELCSEQNWDRAQDFLGELSEAFLDHVAEEETDLFPLLDQDFNTEQRERIGQELQLEKDNFTKKAA